LPWPPSPPTCWPAWPSAWAAAWACSTGPARASCRRASCPADDLRILGLALGSLLIVPLAVVDDRRRLGPWPQLAGQLLIAAVPVAFGLRVSSIAHPFGDPLELPVWLDIPVSILWFVGMMNALNWVDVMDGLAAGVAFLGALVLFGRAFLFTEYSVALFPLALAGVPRPSSWAAPAPCCWASAWRPAASSAAPSSAPPCSCWACPSSTPPG
jgi:UDP-N-acetylmuramyl pentapeptide phosphotransferase/UDP-N-acetylglucosamine-1-phosphate transferase